MLVGWEGLNVEVGRSFWVSGDHRGDRSHPEQLGLPFVEPVSSGEVEVGRSGGSVLPGDDSLPVRVDGLWELVFSQSNLARALQRVQRNGGAPGIDGMTTAELGGWFAGSWGVVRQWLDEGRFRPVPVRRVEIPKPDGGSRMLGVPTVIDRLVQQAIAQVLTPIFDPGFSESSYGFRPGRGPQQAVETALGLVGEGYRWVVDVDLDSFFDRVNHDKLMYRIARRVADRRLLGLIRLYLTAGVMVDGVKMAVEAGTPQGSPLSPLLSNIMLDDLDRELERRGHRFVRYADDLRVFVRSERAAVRVLDGVSGFIEDRLKLKVNWAKSGVAGFTAAGLLGFGFYLSAGTIKLSVGKAARRRVKDRLRRLTRRQSGTSIGVMISRINRFITGWCAYFGIADNQTLFRDLDGWLRRRLRAVQWTQWKTPSRRVQALRQLGASPDEAYPAGHSHTGAWRMAGIGPIQQTLNNRYWTSRGLLGFTHHWQKLRNT